MAGPGLYKERFPSGRRTKQEKMHAFAVMQMKISNLLVKSMSLFRDKSKFESLL